MLMLSNLLLLLCSFPSMYAAPVPSNSTSTDDYMAWQSQSNTRGTWDILVNCVVTMSLCIWTALHLNLPVSEEYVKSKPWWTRMWYHYAFRQIRWVFVGLVAPELVVYMAWTQRNKVDYINQRVKEAQADVGDYRQSTAFSKINTNASFPKYGFVRHLGQPIPWTTAHSWYLLMGGFYFGTSDPDGTEFIEHSPKLILTADCIDLLTCTAPPLLPNIAAEVILDCSKADHLTKLLAMLQAFYMVAQGIGRLASHLPVSQLEVNAIGHVLCAVAIFYFWFDKPKDVRVRTPIREPWARPLCAYMWICDESSCSSETDYPEISRMFPVIEERFNLDLMVYECGGRNPCHSSCHAANGKAQISKIGFWYDRKGFEISGTLCEHGLLPVRPQRITRGRQIDSQFCHSWQRIDLDEDRMPFVEIVMPILWENFRFPKIAQDDMACIRFNLALQYFQYWSQQVWSYLYRGQRIKTPIETIGFDLPPFDGSMLFTKYSRDWQIDSEGSTSSTSSCAKIAIVTFCYGGLHASAWSAHFPSLFESNAWKVSALVIALSGLAIAIECIATLAFCKLRNKIMDSWDEETPTCAAKSTHQRRSYEWLVRLLPRSRHGIDRVLTHLSAGKYRKAMRCANPVVVGFVLLSVLTFTMARLFIVVEAFLSLRSMPAAIYETPNWTPWVPHF